MDRLAFSCFFRMRADGVRLLCVQRLICYAGQLSDKKPLFAKTIIRSVAKLDYGTAQMMIDCEEDKQAPDGKLNGDCVDHCCVLFHHCVDVLQLTVPASCGAMHCASPWPHDVQRAPTWMTSSATSRCVFLLLVVICVALQALNAVAVRRRALRFAAGSLSLQNVRLSFKLDQQQNPVDFNAYVAQDSNKLVEEMMLLANMLVAQQIVLFLRDCSLLRRHPPPQQRGIDKLLAFLSPLHVHLDASSSRSLQTSLTRLESMDLRATPLAHLLDSDGKSKINLKSVVENMATKPMNPAKYFWSAIHCSFHVAIMLLLCCVDDVFCSRSTGDVDPADWHRTRVCSLLFWLVSSHCLLFIARFVRVADFALHFDQYTHFTSPSELC